METLLKPKKKLLEKCYHCGELCVDNLIVDQGKHFCCNGCHTVYNLLSSNDLCTYYDLEQFPGKKIKTKQSKTYAYLDQAEVAKQLLQFEDGNSAQISFYVPAIHCASCIWLLENLHKMEDGVLRSRVDFMHKTVTIDFDSEKVALRHLAEILDTFGYPPLINLEQSGKKKSISADHSLLYKIGIAGFSAGNIMLLSFPEYLGLDTSEESMFKPFLGYLNLILSLPVVFYSASDYFIGAYQGLKNKVLTLDVPIVLGTSAVFIRSVYEVLWQVGPGYFDSLTGLILFLIVGKWFQRKTYQALAFDKDYQAYFPIAITKILPDKSEQYVLLKTLKVNDEVLVRNGEIIPADGILAQDSLIDYSFVTGEARPVSKKVGESVYAGGKNLSNAFGLKLEKEVSQSYLLQLWENKSTNKTSDVYLTNLILTFSRYFTAGTLIISAATFAFWYFVDPSKMLFAVTSVLLVACPCALALSIPFALSNAMRWLGKAGLFLKSTDTVEKLAQCDTIVFDKTGTLTTSQNGIATFVGDNLNDTEKSLIKSLTRQSSHPVSKLIYNSLDTAIVPLQNVLEKTGKGLRATHDYITISLGSAQYIGVEENTKSLHTRSFVSMNGIVKGYFQIGNEYRNDLKKCIQTLGQNYQLHLLSGDNESEKVYLSSIFNNPENIRFNQNPHDKLAYVQDLKKQNHQVAMLGDGLNDAGALMESNVGIAVMDDIYGFSPASDAIIEGGKITQLPILLRYAKTGMTIVKISLGISLAYNAVGLFFAVQGKLNPMVAAILMPMSSVTVVSFVVLATGVAGKRMLNNMKSDFMTQKSISPLPQTQNSFD